MNIATPVADTDFEMHHRRGVFNRRACIAAGIFAPASWTQASLPTIPLALAEGVNRAFTKSLLELLGNAAGLNWQFVSVPFTRLLMLAEQGQALGFGITRTPEREQIFTFSQELFSSGVWAISRRKLAISPSKPQDLQGHRVCTVRGMNYGPELEAIKGTLFDAENSTGDFGTRIRMLMAGHCDVLLITHRNSNAELLERRVQHAGGDLKLVKVGNQALVKSPVQIAVAKGSDMAGYIPKIDQAIQSRRRQIKRLLERSA